MKVRKIIWCTDIFLMIAALVLMFGYHPRETEVEANESQLLYCELALPADLVSSVPEQTNTCAAEEVVMQTVGLLRSTQLSRDYVDREQDKLSYLGKFKVTYYCSGACCNGVWSGHTSTGAVPVAWHTIAVDPKVIPLGSEIQIEGYGKFMAEDVGSAIKGKHIDLLVDSHDEAMRLGVSSKKLYLVS